MPQRGEELLVHNIVHVDLKLPADEVLACSICHPHGQGAYQWWKRGVNSIGVTIVTHEIPHITFVYLHDISPSVIHEDKAIGHGCLSGGGVKCTRRHNRRLWKLYGDVHLEIMLDTKASLLASELTKVVHCHFPGYGVATHSALWAPGPGPSSYAC